MPSGLGYALEDRRLTRRLLPELELPPDLLDAEQAPALLLRTLVAAAPAGVRGSDPAVVLLTDGRAAAAWFEHRLLAAEMGVSLVGPADLRLDGDRLRRRDAAGWADVDVVYARMDEETLAARAGADGVLLSEALTEAVRAGTLVVANALGNSVADDKAVYAYVPRLVEYYLGERPLLADVPTYVCGDPEQREHVLGRLDELVAKPVDGYGGAGVLIGPRATEREVAQVRERVLADPTRWVAQEPVALSTHPTFDGRRLEPRHIDLRAFVLLGERPEVAPAARTRVAPAGSLVVNSSAGGGSKDTWLLR